MENSLTSSSLTFKAWVNSYDGCVDAHTELLTRYFIRRSVKGGRVSANISKFE